MKFVELGLSKPLLDAIAKQNYVEATEIQEMAIPYILNKKDVIGVAQTGTGKTAAFSLPILENLITGSKPDKKIKVLILSPTRELAIQTRDNIKSFGSETEFKVSVVLGGVNQQSQINVLNKGIDILVATPGRLLDLSKRKHADLSNVTTVILDEADTMLDMGFIRDVRQIISKTNKNHQTLLFSATMSGDIKKLSNEFLKDPVTVEVTREATTAPNIKQSLYMVDKNNKSKLLFDILAQEEVETALVFMRTKHGANKLEKEFIKKGVKCSVIHGNKSQNRRVAALSDFKTGRTKVLIATDIAARGIDISSLSHVINYDVPEHPEVYVHRIGRTARAGLEGTSITFCDIDEQNQVKGIEKLIKQKIGKVTHNYPMINFTLTPKKSRGGGRPTTNRNSTRNPLRYDTKRNSDSSKKRYGSKSDGDSSKSKNSYSGNYNKRRPNVAEYRSKEGRRASK
jgi:ATP-dependent RNA helicase RhlE